MFSATSLLVLACACAVSVYADCNNPTIGVKSNFPVVLPTEQFASAVTDVQIPNVPQCVNGESGVSADVCDLVEPSANFTDFNNLIVQRNGPLLGLVTVTVTVYCNF